MWQKFRKSTGFTTLFIVAACARAPVQSPTTHAEVVWNYTVDVGDNGHELRVQARITNALPGPAKYAVSTALLPYFRDVSYKTAGTWAPAAWADGTFTIESANTETELRYRFLLRDASIALRDPDLAAAHGTAFEAPPNAFLLHPAQAPERARMRLTLHTGTGRQGIVSLKPVAVSSQTYESDISNWADMPPSIFGTYVHRTVRSGDAIFEVALVGEAMPEADERMFAWVQQATDAMHTMFRPLPAARSLVLVTSSSNFTDEIHGVTFGHGGAAVRLHVAPTSKLRDEGHDWVLMHELVHLMFPMAGRAHAWVVEGHATYVEPLMRVHNKMISRERFWRDLFQGLPEGLPQEGDRGLERTPTWGRIYWGGAMFFFLCDLALREQTKGKKSVLDVVREIPRRGGMVSVVWPVARIVEEADTITQTHVFREVYKRMAYDGAPVDLAALARSLGVTLEGNHVSFDDTAPKAWLRKQIVGEE